MAHFYRPQRSCGQGYVFTPVCDSVNRGGLRAGRTCPSPPCPPTSREDPPGREEPPQQGDPPAGRPPRQGDPPRADTPPQEQTHPPPGEQTAAYGQWAAGMHPTGMHSCHSCYFISRGNFTLRLFAISAKTVSGFILLVPVMIDMLEVRISTYRIKTYGVIYSFCCILRDIWKHNQGNDYSS